MKLRPPSPAPKKNPATLASKGGVFQLGLDGIEPASKAFYSSLNQGTKSFKKASLKTWTVLAAFMDGTKLHRFQADDQLNEPCLHSTISTLRHRYGLVFDWRDVRYMKPNGKLARPRLYWLEPTIANVERAKSLLGGV
jgi:hypothetical protein